MPKQQVPICVYDFVINMTFEKEYVKGDTLTAHDASIRDVIKETLEAICKPVWGFQVERGENENKLHWQGRLTTKSKMRKQQVLRLIESTVGGRLRWDLTITSTENHEDLYYVTKLHTRVIGPWTARDPKPFIVCEEVAAYYKTIRPWQQQGIDKFTQTWTSEFHKNGMKNLELLSDLRRCINVIYSPEGCQGRSLFGDFMEAYHNAELIFAINDYVKFMQFCCDMYELKKPDIWIVDMPRGLSTDHPTKQREMYGGFETLKGGRVFDPRYEGRKYKFNSPQVIIFSNHIPDPNLCSADRWKIWVINAIGDLVEYQDNDIDPAILNEVHTPIIQSDLDESDLNDSFFD